MTQKIVRYFFNSWIQATGKGWTGKQVFVSYIFSLVFALAIVQYSFFADLQWTWIQILTTALIAWDLGGGVLGYNHKSIKIKQSDEKGILHFFHHNLQHIHPLILIFFYSNYILLGLTIYWLITFFLYVELLEKTLETGKRKISNSGEKFVIVFEIFIAIILIILSFSIDQVSAELRTYGLVIYCTLPVLTLILINIPISFQRTSTIICVATMIVIGMYIGIPNGFNWFITVYFLKLLTGFTAKGEMVLAD